MHRQLHLKKQTLGGSSRRKSRQIFSTHRYKRDNLDCQSINAVDRLEFMKTYTYPILFVGFVLSFFLQGCIHSATSGGRQVANVPRHVIIAVHGVGGDATTWGELGTVVTKHLAAINPNFQPEFYNFTYKASDKAKNTFQYGEESLSEYIEQVIFKDRPLQPHDKISFVAHSQGGLVTSIWYVDTLIAAARNQPGKYNKDLARMAPYANQVETIVTLGTPFWGSKLATRYIDPTKFDPSKTFGIFNPEEMNEMAFGSNTIYQFRRSTIALSGMKDVKDKFKAKLVNIVGVYPKDANKLYYSNIDKTTFKFKVVRTVLDIIRNKFGGAGGIGFGADRYESDVAVLVPSGRLKFLYAEDLDKTNGKSITGDSFKEADFFSGAEWILTESIHSPVVPSYNVAMAYIPKSCENLNDCVHPTYRYVLSALANCGEGRGCDSQAEQTARETLKRANAADEDINKELEVNLKGFAIEVVLRMPNESYDIEDPKFKDKPGVRFYTRTAMSSENDANDDWLFSQKQFFKDCVRIPQEADGRVKGANSLVEVHMGRDKEYLSKVAAWRDMKFGNSSHKDIRLHITGFIKPSKAATANEASFESYLELIKKGVDVPLEIDMPGLQKRQVMVRVRPAISTYLEMQMHALK